MLQSRYLEFCSSIMDKYSGMVSRINPLALIFLEAGEESEETGVADYVTNIHKTVYQTNQYIYNRIVNRYSKNYQNSLHAVRQNVLYCASPNFRSNEIAPITYQYRQENTLIEKEEAVKELLEKIFREYREIEKKQELLVRNTVLEKQLVELLKSFSRSMSTTEVLHRMETLWLQEKSKMLLIQQKQVKQEEGGKSRELMRKQIRQIWEDTIVEDVQKAVYDKVFIKNVLWEIRSSPEEKITEKILEQYVTHILKVVEKKLAKQGGEKQTVQKQEMQKQDIEERQVNLQQFIRQEVSEEITKEILKYSRTKNPDPFSVQKWNWTEILKKTEEELRDKTKEEIKYILEKNLIPIAASVAKGTSHAVLRQEIHKLLQKNKDADQLVEQLGKRAVFQKGILQLEYGQVRGGQVGDGLTGDDPTGRMESDAYSRKIFPRKVSEGEEIHQKELFLFTETLLQQVLKHTDIFKKGKTQYERQIISRMLSLPVQPVNLSFPAEQEVMREEQTTEIPLTQRRVVQMIRQQTYAQKKYYTNLIQRFLNAGREERQTVIDRSELPAGIIYHKKPQEIVKFISQDVVHLFPLDMDDRISTGMVSRIGNGEHVPPYYSACVIDYGNHPDSNQYMDASNENILVGKDGGIQQYITKSDLAQLPVPQNNEIQQLMMSDSVVQSHPVQERQQPTTSNSKIQKPMIPDSVVQSYPVQERQQPTTSNSKIQKPMIPDSVVQSHPVQERQQPTISNSKIQKPTIPDSVVQSHPVQERQQPTTSNSKIQKPMIPDSVVQSHPVQERQQPTISNSKIQKPTIPDSVVQSHPVQERQQPTTSNSKIQKPMIPDSVVDYSNHPGIHIHDSSCTGEPGMGQNSQTGGAVSDSGSQRDKAVSVQGSQTREALSRAGSHQDGNIQMQKYREKVIKHRQIVLHRIRQQIEERINHQQMEHTEQEAEWFDKEQIKVSEQYGINRLTAEPLFYRTDILQNMPSKMGETTVFFQGSMPMAGWGETDISAGSETIIPRNGRTADGIFSERTAERTTLSSGQRAGTIVPILNQQPVSLVHRQDTAYREEEKVQHEKKILEDIVEDIVFEKKIVQEETRSVEVTESGGGIEDSFLSWTRGREQDGNVEKLVNETVSRQVEKSIDQISKKVYRNIENQLKKERERRGM